MIHKIRTKLSELYMKYGISMNALCLYWREKKMNFEDELSIVCIAKFEEAYIKEWVRYHLLQGVDRIYIYDNDSPDKMKQELYSYIKSGKVVYTLMPGKGRQLDAYNDAIRKYKYRTRYMAFIDADEFLVPERNKETLDETVKEIMKKNKRAGGIAVNWRVFGSSGHIQKPDGLVIENYLNRGDGYAKGNDCIKTIANPRFIERYEHVHYPHYYLGFHNIDESGKIVLGWSNPCDKTRFIRINHYFTKSQEEWISRRSKGKADTSDLMDVRSIKEFHEHDNNEVYDDIMLRYVDMLKGEK